jgi:hypothetical protein
MEIVRTGEFDRWRERLAPDQARAILPVLEALEHFGRLSSAVAKPIKSSRHRSMMELKSLAGNIRVLYAVDLGERAVLLLGGDKTNDWDRWYEVNVKRADRHFDHHLRRMGVTCLTTRAGERGLSR